jgi:hypothetical protein
MITRCLGSVSKGSQSIAHPFLSLYISSKHRARCFNYAVTKLRDFILIWIGLPPALELQEVVSGDGVIELRS